MKLHFVNTTTMKKHIKAIFWTAGLLLSMTGCKKFDLLKNINHTPELYLVQSTELLSVQQLPLIADDQELIVSAGLTGVGYAPNDITVTFKEAADTLAVFNQSVDVASQYTLLTAANYKLSSNTTVIKTGTAISEPVKVIINTAGLDPMGRYAIPLTIEGDGTYKVNQANKTVMLVLNGLSNIYAGSYAATGVRENFGADGISTGTVNINATKVLTTLSANEVSVDAIANLAPGRANSEFKLLINPDNTVAISGHIDDVANPIVNEAGKTSTYDPDTKTFKLEYRYTNNTSGGAYRIMTETLKLK